MFCAATQVGTEGGVVGIDFTAEQLEKARGLAERAGFEQVELRNGRIEELPADADAFDCVISNGVINLSPEKDRVFAEAYRVLKESIVCDADLWASCIGGAAQQEAYRSVIEAAGFRIEEMRDNRYEFISDRARDASAKYGVRSISILALAG